MDRVLTKDRYRKIGVRAQSLKVWTNKIKNIEWLVEWPEIVDSRVPELIIKYKKEIR